MGNEFWELDKDHRIRMVAKQVTYETVLWHVTLVNVLCLCLQKWNNNFLFLKSSLLKCQGLSWLLLFNVDIWA